MADDDEMSYESEEEGETLFFEDEEMDALMGKINELANVEGQIHQRLIDLRQDGEMSKDEFLYNVRVLKMKTLGMLVSKIGADEKIRDEILRLTRSFLEELDRL